MDCLDLEGACGVSVERSSRFDMLRSRAVGGCGLGAGRRRGTRSCADGFASRGSGEVISGDLHMR